MKKLLLVGVGLVAGVLGYISFDKYATPDATVIEAVEGVVLLEGTFYDADPAHAASGSFSIVSNGMGGRSIMLSNDFLVANAPDPHVYVNGEKIAKNFWKGGQVFDIPNFIAEDITEVTIFCEIAGINLGLSRIGMVEMMDMLPMRTDGLVVLGTTGMTAEFAAEQMGVSKGKIKGAFTGAGDFSIALTDGERDINAGYFGFAPEIAIVNGDTYRMVAPSITPDNFVVLGADGSVTRYDLGVDEGTNVITIVSKN